MNEFINADCMNPINGLPSYKDKYFDLAIVDPPYGINISNNPFRQKHNKKGWDLNIPDAEYFNELFRVSKNQFICGGNYFNLPTSQGFVIWDKCQPEDFSSSMCEFIWSSFQMPAKIFRYWVVMDKDKIHPTQKPKDLYSWLLTKYAKPNDKILDTHVGSASSLIACEDLGFDYVGYELDADYYKSACKRIEQFRSQLKLSL